jgi:hypothetical protein
MPPSNLTRSYSLRTGAAREAADFLVLAVFPRRRPCFEKSFEAAGNFGGRFRVKPRVQANWIILAWGVEKRQTKGS